MRWKSKLHGGNSGKPNSRISVDYPLKAEFKDQCGLPIEKRKA